MTRAPNAPARSATSRPSPSVEPVTITTLPFNGRLPPVCAFDGPEMADTKSAAASTAIAGFIAALYAGRDGTVTFHRNHNHIAAMASVANVTGMPDRAC